MSGNEAQPVRFCRAATLLVAVFLMVPLAILFLQSLTAHSHLSFPPERFGLRWYVYVLTERDWLEAIGLSLLIAGIVTPLALSLGAAAALGLDRGPMRGRREFYALVVSPMVLPHIVLGLALFHTFLWIDLNDTVLGFVLGHLTITVPYVVVTVGASLRTFDRTMEEAAQSLGASPVRTLLHVTLPIIRPGLIAGAIFTFITSFDEFIITYFLSTFKQTLPLQIFGTLTYQVEPSIAAVSGLTMMVTAALTALLVTRGQVVSRGRVV